jgi:ferredoxin
MMLEIVIDNSLCAGFGDCAAHAPTAFELDRQGKAVLRALHSDDDDAVLDAVAACPMGAISVVEVQAA